ncbi:MAG TPA: Ig-like domain-containing protein, partial [Thermoplasmata archaeon]|nr:Ig-like domain-containing protein [Thermoplasmata archaeon]
KKDGVGATSYNAWSLAMSGTVAPITAKYVNFDGPTRLNATGDDLEIVWNNPGGTGFGGNDIVVDRVEWNQSSSGTHYWESSNTNMTDAALTLADAALMRNGWPVANGTDTNDNAVDFTASGTECGRTTDPVPQVTITTPVITTSWTGGMNHNIVWQATDPAPGAAPQLTYWVNYSTTSATGPWTLIAGPSTLPSAQYGIAQNTVWNAPCPTDTSVWVSVDAADAIQRGGAVSPQFEIDCTAPNPTPSPSNGASGVPTNTPITVIFDEGMNTALPTTADVTFSGGETVTGLSWTGNTMVTITVSPSPLIAGQPYTWGLSCNFKDDSDTGNALAGCPTSWTFTTAGNPSPTVTLTSPAGGEIWTGGSNHNILWDPDDDGGSLTYWINYSLNGGALWTAGPTGNVLTPYPPQTTNWPVPLADTLQAQIQVCVGDGASTTCDTSPNFEIDSTRDTPTPNPANGAPGVPTAAGTFTISFNDNTPAGAMSTAPTLADVSFSVGGILTGISWNSPTNNLLTVTHNALAAGTTYTWGINCNFEDSSDPGNTVQGCPTTWTFDTAGGRPVVSNLAVDLQTVPPGVLHIMNPTSPTFSWSYSDPDGDPQTQASWDVLDPSGLFWTNSPLGTATTDTYAGQVLLRGVDYDLVMEVTDGLLWSLPVTLSFRLNLLPPAPTLVSPSNNAINVPAGTTTLTWNPVTDADGDSVTYEYCVGSALNICDLASGSNGALTAYDHVTSPLTTYFWRVRAFDSYEYQLGWSANWRFTTAAAVPPTVNVDTPTGGEDWTGGTTHDVLWTPGDTDSIDLWWWLNYTLTGAAPFTASLSGTLTAPFAQQTTAWLVPFGNTTNAQVQVCVDDGRPAPAVCDPSPDFTIDSSRPTFTNLPLNLATGVAVNANIVITFSEAMDTVVTGPAVTVSPDPGVTRAWSAGNTTLTLTHTTAFTASTPYTVTVGAAGLDVSDTGNAVVGGTFSFTTGSVDVTDPTAVINAPGTSVQEDTPITFDGTASSDPNGTIASYSWEVRDQNGALLPGGAGTLSTFTFTFPQPGTYTVTLTVTDAAGRPNTAAPVTMTVTQKVVAEPFPWWIVILLIIVVAVMLLLFFLMKRRKKEEEEAVPPPPGAAPPPPEELPPPPGAALAPPARAPPPRAAPPPPRAPPRAPVAPPPPPAAAPPAAATKECASCGTIVSASDTECFMCGAKL